MSEENLTKQGNACVGSSGLLATLRKSEEHERLFGNQHAELLKQAADEIERQAKAMSDALWHLQNGVLNPMANTACKRMNLDMACELLANTKLTDPKNSV
jgi:hypothetical protein